MTDVFNAITRGVSRFALTWLLPSALTIGIFSLVVGNVAATAPPVARIRDLSTGGPLVVGVMFALASVTLATVLAYGSLPIYRLLEGYTLPKRWQARWVRRQQGHWLRLRQRASRLAALGLDDGEIREQLKLYPETLEDIRATRLGNAHRALETFAVSRYELNSQAFWYELRASVSEVLRTDSEEARGGVDLFISALVHLLVLIAAATFVSIWYGSLGALILGLLALLLLRPAYDQAVTNMLEWRYAVQALVNLGRAHLAAELGLVMPHTFETERAMWNTLTYQLEMGIRDSEKVLDELRRKFPLEDSNYSLRVNQDVSPEP